MKKVTSEMIKEYNMKKLKYDFMGYIYRHRQELSFHHLILARKYCKEQHLNNRGYWKWNGAILVQDTSHEYLHLIELLDEEIFYRITSELLDQNIKGRIDVENLKQIRDFLLYFEKEYVDARNHDNQPMIKEKYLTKRIIL